MSMYPLPYSCEADQLEMITLALYESLGFRIIQDVTVFCKDYGEAP